MREIILILLINYGVCSNVFMNGVIQKIIRFYLYVYPHVITGNKQVKFVNRVY
jgi:hypothetical protein